MQGNEKKEEKIVREKVIHSNSEKTCERGPSDAGPSLPPLLQLTSHFPLSPCSLPLLHPPRPPRRYTPLPNATTSEQLAIGGPGTLRETVGSSG